MILLFMFRRNARLGSSRKESKESTRSRGAYAPWVVKETTPTRTIFCFQLIILYLVHQLLLK